jgi:nucleoid-associated protein YgaU
MVGTVLKIPPLSSTDRAAAAPRTDTATLTAAETDRTYRVQSGDSFYAIARDVLGDADRWKELLELNSSLVDGDPVKLRPGQVLRLPADSPTAGE